MTTAISTHGVLPVWQKWPGMDPVLLTAVLSLLGFSMVMVFSAVAGIDADPRGGLPVLSKHVFSTALGVAIVLITARLNLSLWQRWNRQLLFVGIVLLVLVLIPEIGQKVNGSFRWIALGPLRFQPSELIKVFVIVSLADYCCRSSVDIRNFRTGIVLPSAVLGVIALLLLREPDYGCTAVVLVTAYAMIFLAGARLLYLVGVFAIAASALSVLVMFSPERMDRIASFLDPRSDLLDGGYQLHQALIAFASGEWFGTGLGTSVQKLSYLPEANTDFLAAVIGEELGWVGLVLLLAVYVIIFWRAFDVARWAAQKGQLFGARIAQGVGMLIALQMLINIGVNLGVLPTKGLTLPLVSYGGSSMIGNCFAIGLVLAVYREAVTSGRRSP